ncbi:metal-dependent hydrolase [Microaerobacter geothermalis]|uniref:metal-dependent hydrolase n=1 Tax=Microaerobacter geothermalis TaxID=674972 RepID=UPI001F46F20B|nr:metal-dependent hydrolase [Microaerobacter geothermalis]MCF6093031.1 metal-dependent hydrolase [Microaerobacter geothermalis]
MESDRGVELVDNLTHGLLGYTVFAAAKKDKWTEETKKAIFWGSILGAEAPDIDVISGWFGDIPSLLWHRSWTHSILGSFVMAGLVMGLVLIFNRRADKKTLYLYSWAGVLTHIISDALTSWGTQLLLPFSDLRISLNAWFIIDLFILVLLLSGLFLKKFWNRERVFRFIGTVLTGYMVLQLLLSSYASMIAKEVHPNAKDIAVMPNWLFGTYKEVVNTGDQVDVYLFSLWNKKEILQSSLASQDNEAVQKALTTESAQAILTFAKNRYFVTQVEEDDDIYVITIFDPRFFGRGEYFVKATVKMDKELNVIEESL